MRMKEKIGEAFRLYFILVTLITVLLFILGTLFDNGRALSYDAFLSPLIYATIGVMPVFFFDSDKEVSIKGLIFRRIVQLAAVEIAIMVLAIFAPKIDTSNKGVVIGIAVGIAIVFALSMLIEYIFELSISKKMNEDLERFQKS